MLVDLVQTTTRDGVRLDGCFQAAAGSAPRSLHFDAACFVHGTGSNFYGSAPFDEIAAALLERGCAVLRANTRGHDGISTAVTVRGGRRQGAAYELVDDCRHDLVAWVDWLRQRAGARVCLLGHSLGAVKCIYAAVHEPALEIAGVVALSPPRLSYAWFCSSPEGREFLETFRRAEALIEANQGATLLEVRLPLPMIISAGGYVEKYGPEERYNVLRFLDQVPCPVLVTLGEWEVRDNVAFRQLPEELTVLASRHPREVTEIPGADHFYTGARKELMATVTTWLGRSSSSHGG